MLIGPRLEPALRMVYFDERGSGRSERPWTGHYQLDTLVADVEALRQTLGVSKIALIGHSNTGEIGRALAQAGLYDEYRFTASARLTMPILVVAGRHDGGVGLTSQEELAHALPHARLLIYERSAHFPYVEEPERFARDVTAFLTSQ